MNSPKVMAYFSIIGDYFPLEEVSNLLRLTPTEKYYKGDLIEEPPNLFLRTNRKRKRIETDWTLSTYNEESYDINDQLSFLLNSLKGKEEILKEVRKKYDLSFLFMVIIELESTETPAIYLEEEIIHFASNIQAEIHFDLVL